MTGSLEGVVCGNIGVGAVGSYWTRLQRKEGANVLVYDVNAERAMQVAEDYGCEAVDLDTLLNSSDWVSVAVLPLKEVFNVMVQISERKGLLKPGSLLLDHSGVKTGTKSTLDRLLRGSGKEVDTFATAQLKAVEGRDDVEAIALHLAFRPDVELEGQNIYASQIKPAEGGLWMPRIAKLLTSYQANFYQMTPEQQDLVTLRQQMIPWMAVLIALDSVRKSGSDMSFAEIDKLTTKFSRPLFDLMKRIVSGNPQVYGDTMFHHPFASQAAQLLSESIREFSGQLANGSEEWFINFYRHLQAVAASGSPERKTGAPIMVEIYYDGNQYEAVRKALNAERLQNIGFLGNVGTSIIDSGRINELHKAGIPVASYTVHASRDGTKQPDIAFYVRNVSHPEHPERKGIRFSPTVPRNLARSQQINPDYTRVQLTPLHSDPIVNFFNNIRQDPILSKLEPFVVYKPL